MMQAVPPAADRVVGGPDRDRQADGLERVVEPVAGELGLERVELVGLARVGGAEPLGVLELRVDQVDRDDLGRAGDPRALDGGDADAAAAEHDDRRAGRRPWRC